LTEEIKVGFKSQTRITVNHTGNMITEEKQILGNCKEHSNAFLKEAFNRPTTGHDLYINMDYHIQQKYRHTQL